MTTLRRYSLVGQIAVAAVIATGAINTRLIVHAWPLNVISPYRELLAMKIGLMAAMAALALFNRYRLAPRLSREPAAAARALSISILVELAAGSAVIALVSAFATFDPV